jgi:2',3'-cyclic-nucleotide 2'-phosphodiesterase
MTNTSTEKEKGALRFLVFGDVMGRSGREAISKALPDLKKEYEPDSVIVNVENIAHGKGISPSSMEEAFKWGVDVFTTGDHAWDNKGGISLLEKKDAAVIRPANYPAGVPGRGYHIFNKGAWQVAVINLQGQVFFRNDPFNPFLKVDEMLEQEDIKQADIVLIDFHAEASSEKRGMGWYVDGRVSAIWGTNTHVPTADAQIMPDGTGYLSDAGMNGAYDSIIGVDKVAPLKMFLTQTKEKMEPAEGGPLEVSALLIDVDPKSKKTINIAHIRRILNDSNI